MTGRSLAGVGSLSGVSQGLKYNALVFQNTMLWCVMLGSQKRPCHRKKGPCAPVGGRVGASDKQFSKLVVGTTPNYFRLWNIGAPLALF